MIAEGVTVALRATLADLDLDEADRAASALAWRLAEAIEAEDSGRTVAELAGKLLAVLVELGATPAARKALVKGVIPHVPGERTALDELRAKRAARQD